MFCYYARYTKKVRGWSFSLLDEHSLFYGFPDGSCSRFTPGITDRISSLVQCKMQIEFLRHSLSLSGSDIVQGH